MSQAGAHMTSPSLNAPLEQHTSISPMASCAGAAKRSLCSVAAPKRTTEHGWAVGAVHVAIFCTVIAFVMYIAYITISDWHDTAFSSTFIESDSLALPAFAVTFQNWSTIDGSTGLVNWNSTSVKFAKHGAACQENPRPINISGQPFFFGNVNRTCELQRPKKFQAGLVDYIISVELLSSTSGPRTDEYVLQMILNIGFGDPATYSTTEASRLTNAGKNPAVGPFVSEYRLTTNAVGAIAYYDMTAKRAQFLDGSAFRYGAVTLTSLFNTYHELIPSARLANAVHFGFPSMSTEVMKEYRLHDITTLISAVGGALSVSGLWITVFAVLVTRWTSRRTNTIEELKALLDDEQSAT